MRLVAERCFVTSFRGLLNAHEADQLHDGADVALVLSQQFTPGSLRTLLGGLWRYSALYCHWALVPTGVHCPCCPCLARDEYISLALLAAMQRRDGDCARCCLDLMVHPQGREPIGQSAMELMLMFQSAGLQFQPVSEREVKGSVFPVVAARPTSDLRLH